MALAMGVEVNQLNTSLLSRLFLVMAYATCGHLLHSYQAGVMVWLGCGVFVLAKAGILTLFWRPVRRFFLLGLQSDAGYSLMVLLLASLAVLAAVQIRTFSCVTMLLATAILVRVDSLVDRVSDRWAFLTLILLPAIGLGLSFVPILLSQGTAASG
jgi:hypothetical protein